VRTVIIRTSPYYVSAWWISEYLLEMFITAVIIMMGNIKFGLVVDQHCYLHTH
jgi:hypothetical protein